MFIRNNILLTFLVCFAFTLSAVGMNSPVYAGQKSKHETQQRVYGKVTETFDVPGYTYVEVNTGDSKVWAAGPVTSLKTGDMIAFSKEMPMKNYHSKTLKRDFPVIYFVSRFITDKEIQTGKAEKNSSSHGRIKTKPAAKPLKGIKKVKGGNTIAEIHASKKSLAGKSIRVRGQVTRYSPEIMGKNWLHVRDSSTLEDLTVTTKSKVAVGDIVIIKGKLELDKDYGYGYVYPVIVDNSQVTRE